jgi:hypothetical protein
MLDYIEQDWEDKKLKNKKSYAVKTNKPIKFNFVTVLINFGIECENFLDC